MTTDATLYHKRDRTKYGVIVTSSTVTTKHVIMGSYVLGDSF